MNWKDEYQKWYINAKPEIQKELEALSEKEKEDAFYKELAFGTAGMRGKMGFGPNRVNKYTIRKITTGYAKYLSARGKKSVVIAFDNRKNSKEFANSCAEILASLNIKVYIFKELRPTPELSYAVRYLDADGGIMITASHNPPEYNGYKVYDEKGCQLVSNYTDQLVSYIEDLGTFDFEVTYNKELITYLDDEVDNAYLNQLKSVRIRDIDCSDVKVVYTPLHGTGSVLIPRILNDMKVDVELVKEQMDPDPMFTNAPVTNPENLKAYEYAKKYDGDVIFASDPDADRLGVMIKHHDKYRYIKGNDIGALIINYIVNAKDCKNKVMIDSIVSSNFASDIAKENRIRVISTYTGFKNIGQAVDMYKKNFIFGYEESIGYLIKGFVRDKDSHQPIILLTEMIAYYKNMDRTLIDILHELYTIYGYYSTDTINIALEGKQGIDKMNSIMDMFRKINEGYIKIDYLNGLMYQGGANRSIDYDPSNALKFIYEDESFFAIRPSGTEPKIKIYFCFKGSTREEAEGKKNVIKNKVLKSIESNMK